MTQALVPRNPPRETITIENAEVMGGNWRNFTGEKRQYTVEGDRNFNIKLAERDGLHLLAQGWNVKPLKRYSDEEDQYYYLKVKVSFRGKPPSVNLVSSRGIVLLGEDLVGILDHTDLTVVDLTFAAYNYDIQGRQGKAAYLQKMYATMYEDALDLKYAHLAQTRGLEAPQDTAARMPYDIQLDEEDIDV